MNSERLLKFVEIYNSFKSSQKDAKLYVLDAFLERYALKVNNLRRSSVLQFNSHDILSRPKGELRQSNILAWLLNFRESHCEGDRFIKIFLKAAGIDTTELDLKSYRIRQEYVGLESIVDIVIYKRGNFIIYIENKILSGEGKNQVDREYNDLIRAAKSLWIDSKSMYAIFLTPDGKSPTNGNPKHWICLSYNTIFEILSKELESIKSQKLRYFLCDWMNSNIW